MPEKTAADFYCERHGHEPSEATHEQRQAEHSRLCEVAELKGFKPGWVAHKYKELFGEWPPRAGDTFKAPRPRKPHQILGCSEAATVEQARAAYDSKVAELRAALAFFDAGKGEVVPVHPSQLGVSF